jgi:PKD repeat protein
MTGGNYWMPEAIQYLDIQGKLRLGGGLTDSQITAVNDGANRAKQQLDGAVALEVTDNILKVINLTGHKVISGYPEGRRMWINIKWYDINDALLRQDGAYGQIGVTIPNPAGGPDILVESIIDLSGSNTKIYEAHYGMTQEWANQLVSLGKPAAYPLSYDRSTGAVDYTLGDLAGQAPGTYHETFHFVINNKVIKDNRIPPYGMRYDIARARNALPVPAGQYGSPVPGGTYNYWDELTLNPPLGADHADIHMLYQPTSWEYVQFLYLANNGTDPAQGGNAFLGMEGEYMLDAWLNNGMAPPYEMASATWTAPGAPPPVADPNGPYTGVAGQTISLDGSGSIGDIVLYEWDIDDDGNYEYSSASSFQSHIYAQQGTYTIWLKVTDNLSRTDEAMTTATVSPPVYTLTVNITGSGTVTSLPSGIDCNPDCEESYTDGTVVTLSANTSQDFIFTGWSGDPDCTDGAVTMDAVKNCTATFEACADRLVWVEDAVPEFYTSIQSGYIAAADSKSIMVQAEAFTEDINLNLNKTISLLGGYNCEFSSIIGVTTVNGNLITNDGETIIGDIIVTDQP